MTYDPYTGCVIVSAPRTGKFRTTVAYYFVGKYKQGETPKLKPWISYKKNQIKVTVVIFQRKYFLTIDLEMF